MSADRISTCVAPNSYIRKKYTGNCNSDGDIRGSRKKTSKGKQKIVSKIERSPKWALKQNYLTHLTKQ